MVAMRELRRHDDLQVHGRDLVHGGAYRSLCLWRCKAAVPYTHLRAHATKAKLGCRLLLEKNNT